MLFEENIYSNLIQLDGSDFASLRRETCSENTPSVRRTAVQNDFWHPHLYQFRRDRPTPGSSSL